MVFSIPFFLNFKYFEDENLQLNINFKPKLEQLMAFVKEYQRYRINVKVSNYAQDFKAAINILCIIRKEIPESKLILALSPYYIYNKQAIRKIEDNDLPFYFDKNVINLDEFNYFLSLGVCDIKIGGELGFYSKFLSKKAKKNSINLRAEADICRGNPKDSFKSFFIRPEDIEIYSNYIDTFELVHDKEFLNTIYEVYTRDKKWYGKLKEIILNYEGEQDSRYILSIFSQIRSGCKKRCYYEDSEKTCNMCDRILEMEDSLKENGIVVSKEKENEKSSN